MRENRIRDFNRLIVILLFCASIFTPFLAGIFESDKAISKMEKRTLSKRPGFPESIADISAFPRLFDNYYSDHFGLRERLTGYYKRIKHGIGDSPSEDVTIGKNGWLFLGSVKSGYNKHGDPMSDARNADLYSEADLKRTAKHLASLKAWLNEKGIEYVFVIAPNKHTIYPEQLPDHIAKVNDRSSTDQLFDYLKNNTDVPTVDLRGPLLKEKEKHLVYYKTDTHWNHHGANIAQYEIMKEIEKLFPGQIEPEKLKMKIGTGKGGDLASYIGVQDIEESHPRPVFGKTCTPARHPADCGPRTTHTFTCEGQKLKALVFRDSFFTTLQPYFARKFHSSTYVFEKSDYPSLEKQIQLHAPDLVIEEWVERGLPHVPKRVDQFESSYARKRFADSDETLFSNDWDRLAFNGRIEIVDKKNGALRIKATGKDPSMKFPPLSFDPNGEYILRVKMICSVKSILQVFFSDVKPAGPLFSEKNSIRFPVKKGDNDIYIALDRGNLGRHLRLDPILEKGEIEIESLAVKNSALRNLASIKQGTQ